MAIGLGTTSSIAFGTSAFVSNILSINGADLSREAIDTSYLGSPNGVRTFIVGTLLDGGTVDVEFQLEMDTVQTVNLATLMATGAETITITLPNQGVSAATISFSGFCTSASWNLPLEELATGTLTHKVAGAITWTDGT